MKTIRYAVALTVLVAAVVAPNVFGQASFHANKGKPAPAFKMTDTKGKVHTNTSLKGKVVLLDFWATWCGPCKAASPTMQKLHSKYSKKGLVVIGANALERGDAKAATVGYQKEHNYTYTFTYGNDALAQTLGIRGIPAFVFIGKDGKIAETFTGYGPSADARFEATIQKLLSQ